MAKPKSDKPQTETEKMEDWRRKRAQRGALNKPNLKGNKDKKVEK